MDIKLFLATRPTTQCGDLWRLELQREKLRSAGHWGERSRSGAEGDGGGNDTSRLPAAGAFGAPGERERSLRGQTPHSLSPTSPAL